MAPPLVAWQGGTLGHAGWGVVSVVHGRPAERVVGPLPSALSQTAANAELAALSVAAQLADPATRLAIRQGCKAAVGVWARLAASTNSVLRCGE